MSIDPDAILADPHYLLQFFDSAITGKALVEFDGTFRAVNDRYCEILGRERHAILGRTFQEFTSDKDVEQHVYMAKGVQQGPLDSYKMYKDYVLPDDSSVHVAIVVRPLFDKEGVRICFITECVKVEQLHSNAPQVVYDRRAVLVPPSSVEVSIDWPQTLTRAGKGAAALLAILALIGAVWTGLSWLVEAFNKVDSL